MLLSTHRHSIWWLFSPCSSPCRPLTPPSPRYLASSVLRIRFPTRSIADGVFFPVVRLPQTVGFHHVSEFDGPSFSRRETLSGGGEDGRHAFRGPRSYAAITSEPSSALPVAHRPFICPFSLETVDLHSFPAAVYQPSRLRAVGPGLGPGPWKSSPRFRRERSIAVASTRRGLRGGGKMLPNPAGDELRSAERYLEPTHDLLAETRRRNRRGFGKC